MAKTSQTPDHPTFHVGDRVLAPFGLGKVRAVVIEDRGPLGAGGRQIVRVRVPPDLIPPFEEAEFAAEELEPDTNGT